MIYISDHIDDFDLQEALDAVSPQRRKQALRYRHERDQRLCIAAYRLLRQALHEEYGIQELPQFVYNQHGKPLLDGYADIHFSMSHCRMAAAVAVSDQPVGIDVETLDQYSEEVARHAMSDREMRQILSSPHPAKEFTRLWTMKESLYKLTGDDHGGDIAHMLDNATAYQFTTLDYPDYLLTTCQGLHADGLNL